MRTSVLTFNVDAQYELAFAGANTPTLRVKCGHVTEQWATLFQKRSARRPRRSAF